MKHALWTISIRDNHGNQLTWWRADSLPDIAAVRAVFPTPVHVVQQRFLPAIHPDDPDVLAEPQRLVQRVCFYCAAPEGTARPETGPCCIGHLWYTF
mgnify:CR=1 FL=1